MKKLFLLFFMSLYFVTCCRQWSESQYPRLEDSIYLNPLVREWASRYNTLPETPIELYFFEDPDTILDVEYCVAVLHVGQDEIGHLFGYNGEDGYWADFGANYEGYDLEGDPDETIAFSSDVTLQPLEYEYDSDEE